MSLFSAARRRRPPVVAGLLVLVSMAAARNMPAQTPTILSTFPTGAVTFPSGMGVQGRDGSYDAASMGGAGCSGTVYSITLTGVLKWVDCLTPSSANYLYGGVLMGADGFFYGNAPAGGTDDDGVVFKVSATGSGSTLYSFTDGGDGGGPNTPPVLGNDGNYYGVASGSEDGSREYPSTFYKFTPAGKLTTLHTFAGTEGQGCNWLTLGSDGDFYTPCLSGGTNNQGTLVKITAAGAVTVLHNFDGTDGASAQNGGPLVQANDGNYYGVTYQGGSNGDGVAFRLTPAGVYTVLYNFGGTGGTGPQFGLTLGPNGTLYGTTYNGGTSTNCKNNCGTIYSLTTAGKYTTLYNFDGSSGFYPLSNLMLDTNGLLYGTTNGMSSNDQTFYSFNLGFAPFVSLVTAGAQVGATAEILGQDFSALSIVKFNGVTATSVTRTGTSYLSATVPPGATTGYVTVTTGATTLTSSKKFTVHDAWSSGAAIPTAVSAAGAAAVGTKIYVFGGNDGAGTTLTDNQIYNTSTNAWTTGAPLPTARFVPAVVAVRNMIYVIGGKSGGSQLNVVEAYDTTTNAWSTEAPMPLARDSITAAVEGGIIYVVGGYDGASGRLTTVQSYDPATNVWTSDAPLMVAKSLSAVGVVGKTLISAGGLSSSGVTGDNEGYDAQTNSWSTLTADPTPRQAACAATVGGTFYVAGGANSASALSVTEAFAANKDTWTTLASMPQAAETPASATANGLLYCIGGQNLAGTVYDEVQIYQP